MKRTFQQEIRIRKGRHINQEWQQIDEDNNRRKIGGSSREDKGNRRHYPATCWGA